MKNHRPSKLAIRMLVVVLVSLLAACDLPNDVTSTTLPGPTEPPATEPTGTETPIATPQASETPAATPSVAPSATPGEFTPTPIAGTPTPEPELGNLFENPSFEGGYRPVIFGEVWVAWGWEPFYCDTPYTPEKCPSERRGEGNPESGEGSEMGRPEFGAAPASLDPLRVRTGGASQKWFCFWRTCRAGVYQVIQTTPGQQCFIGGHVQSWQNAGISTDVHISDILTMDMLENSQWRILIDQHGGGYAFSEEMNVQREAAPVFLNTYDHFEDIAINVTAESYQMTVFFENTRLWPFQTNDSYLDDVYAYCGDAVDVATPPADPPPPGILPGDEIVREHDPLIVEEQRRYRAEGSQYIRADHGKQYEVVGGMGADQRKKYHAIWVDPATGDEWLCVDQDIHQWVDHPIDLTLQYFECHAWTAYKFNGRIMGSKED